MSGCFLLTENIILNFPDLTEAQRLALPAAGGTRLARETDKTQSHEKIQFSGANPAVRVHAVLGSSCARLLQKIDLLNGTTVRTSDHIGVNADSYSGDALFVRHF